VTALVALIAGAMLQGLEDVLLHKFFSTLAGDHLNQVPGSHIHQVLVLPEVVKVLCRLQIAQALEKFLAGCDHSVDRDRYIANAVTGGLWFSF
jgi:hypothetical protein